MKKDFVVISLIFSIFLFGCSNSQTSENETYLTQTIKSVVKTKDEDEIWTEELEATRLSFSLNENKDIIAENVHTSPNVYKILEDYKSPVYPTLFNFTSLDVSLIDDFSLSKIKEFCTYIAGSQISAVSNFFNNDYKFNYVFFKNNLQKIYTQNFGENAFDGSEILFENYHIGKPIFDDDGNFMQVPLLFENQKGKLYLEILVNPKESNIIYQSIILKWELKSGQ